MTALAALQQTFVGRRPVWQVVAAVAAFVALVLAAGMILAFRGSAADTPPTAVVEIPPAKADALVAATSANAAVDAVGARAEIINASLPFSRSPIEASNPFDLSGDALDQRRALLCMTQAIYYEAGFEPVEGRRAVAQVVLNRLRHPAFPKSVCGVVYQGSRSPVCQFSFVCDGSLYRAPAAEAWREARKIAEAALSGYVDKAVGAATHYHADYVAPGWGRMLAKIAQIGHHIFYRWPGSWGTQRAFTGRYIGEPLDPLALRPPLRVESPVAEVEVAEAGPPVARAPNDVGGLLDTSKGWTLTLPDSGSAAAKTIAQQSGSSPQHAAAGVEIAAATAGIVAPAAGAR